MTVFVPGPLRNPMNGSHGHWSKHRRWAKDWRERTHQHLFVALRGRRDLPTAAAPKRVHFLLHTHNNWDDDAYGPGLKPVRDALKDAGVIHDDSKKSGHTFTYDQKIARAHRGVLITWDLASVSEPARSGE